MHLKAHFTPFLLCFPHDKYINKTFRAPISTAIVPRFPVRSAKREKSGGDGGCSGGGGNGREKSYRNRGLETISEFLSWRDRGSTERKRTINESFRGPIDHLTRTPFVAPPRPPSLLSPRLFFAPRPESRASARSNCTRVFARGATLQQSVFPLVRTASANVFATKSENAGYARRATPYLLFGFFWRAEPVVSARARARLMHALIGARTIEPINTVPDRRCYLYRVIKTR